MFFIQKKSMWVLLLVYMLVGIIWNAYQIINWILSYNCCNPLSYVIVTGNRYFTTNSDINNLIIQLGLLGTFITQDVNIIQRKIECLPWIKQVSVRKKWPDTLKINLVEYIPVACWNNIAVISATGRIFTIPEYRNDECFIKNLPILYGPNNKNKEVLYTYLIFSEVLKSNKLQIKSIMMDANYSWELILHNDICLKLGKKNIFDRLYYFIKIYPFLLQKIDKKNKYIDYIDLRYYSGFAVKWFCNEMPIVFCKK